MKAGTFNINEYLDKLHENVNEEDLTLNEETENGSLPDSEGFILPKENRKAYDWLKREFQKGKTEVKVEMSYYTFKPGYELEDAPKSTKAFPGMYGDVKHDTTNKPESTAAPFPETKFPVDGDNSANNSDSKTKTGFDNKTNNKSESSEEEEDKTQNGIKVEAKTKEDCIEEEKEKKKKKKENNVKR